MSNTINVLLIEDEQYDVNRVINTIQPFSERISIRKIVSSGKDATDVLTNPEYRFDVVVMDFQIAGGIMGEALIQGIKEIDSTIQIIVITKMTVNITDYNFAHRLLKAGAFWYCTKYPGDIEDYIYQPTDFILSIFNAYEKCLLERERIRANQRLIKNIEDILSTKVIIGQSEQMLNLKREIKKLAETNVNTIIRGASGTGKELVAYNIHYNSARRFENFVTINCGSLPSELIESELFGYEKGAFTGADKKKAGLFEMANNGTVFLDEITELPLSAQVKLLRVIQSGEIEKLGRTEKIQVNVRVLAATNRNVEEEVKEKRFREDLYYRLNVIQVRVPELKNHRGDIPQLVDYFLGQLSLEMGKARPDIENDALQILADYDWPGNVRELRNIVQRLLFLNDYIITGMSAKSALGIYETDNQNTFSNPFEMFTDGKLLPLSEMEKLVRKQYFIYVRNASNSDSEAAKKLGLAPPNFYRMAKELGLK